MKLRLPPLIREHFPCEQTDLALPPAAVAEVIAAFIYTGTLDRPTKPILVLTGPPGSGKTSTARGLVRLLEGPDENVSVVPKSPEDLLVVAGSRRFLALDNVEGNKGWLADALAATATGARFSARKLYTNAVVADIELTAALILTSMDCPFSRADVLDRTIIIPMRRLAAFVPEAAVQRRIDGAREDFLKALDADLALLRPALESDGDLEESFRMADFAQVGRLVWGEKTDGVLAAITEDQAAISLRDDAIVDVLTDLTKSQGALSGSAGVIRRLVRPRLDDLPPEARTDRLLGDHLRRISQPAKSIGLSIVWRHDRHSKANVYTITSKGYRR